MQADLAAFLDVAALTLSPRTVEIYGREIRRLAVWLAGRPASSVTEADLARYLAERRAAGVGPAGIGQAVGAFRRFFRWKGLDCAATLPFPPAEERQQRTLSEAEMEAVLESCDTSSVIGTRDLAIFMLLWDSGLRASELCALQMDRLRLDERVFFVLAKAYRGRRRERFGAFSDETAQQIRQWLSVRGQVALPATSTVFCSVGGSRPGTPLSRRGLQGICMQAAEAAGVDHFSPHAIRRGMATDAIANGCPDEVLRRFMGWRTSRMLSVYTRALGPAAFAPYLGTARLAGRRARKGE